MENNDKYIEKMIKGFRKVITDNFSECNDKLIGLSSALTDKIISIYNFLISKPIVLMIGKNKSGNLTRYYLVRDITLEKPYPNFASSDVYSTDSSYNLEVGTNVSIRIRDISFCFSDISELKGKSNNAEFFNYFAEIRESTKYSNVDFRDIVSGEAFSENKYFHGASIESLTFEYFDTLESLILYMSNLEDK